MPSVFQLTRRGDNSPAFLQTVDRAICQSLELEFSDKLWAYAWYDTIGLMLAMGRSFGQIADDLKDSVARRDSYSEADLVRLRICHFLNENYTADSWREWK